MKNDQIIQLSQEIIPTKDIPTIEVRNCYIKQNGQKIMLCRDTKIYDRHLHQFHQDKKIKKKKTKTN